MIETKNLIDQFSNIYNIEKHKLPYHINLLDELRVDENAHSRILQKLLQYNTVKTKSYDILENFIEFIIEKYPDKTDFRKISMSNPLITQEHQRIDLWIRDWGKYAIVIENKVHNATDQNVQLQRYIDSTVKDGFSEDQIYVIYLPPTYTKEPDKYSWGSYYDGSIKNQRFLNLSFKDDILPWLKYKLLPEIKLKDRYLISSIEQYVDHLEGLFSLRTINKNMNMELQRYLTDELKLNELAPEIALNTLNSKMDEVQVLLNQLNEIETKMIQDFFYSWNENLKRDFRSFKIVGNWENFQAFTNIGIEIYHENKSFTLLIEYNKVNGVYYGIGRHHTSNELFSELNFKEIINNLNLSTTRCNGWWYGWRNTTFSDAYHVLSELINEVNTKVISH